MDEMAIYNRLPVWGQNLACYAEGRRIQKTRYGKDFWQFLAEYESRANWSYEQLCDYRDAKLRRMIHHCYDTVPYYYKLFQEGGINPDSIKTLDDVQVLPILTKQMVNANPESFISSAIPRDKMVIAHTSGTTGSGFVFKTTQEAFCEQWAVWWRYRRAIGIKYGMLCGLFGGRSVVPITVQTPPFFRWNKPANQLYFSTYHMNEKNLVSYVSTLKKFNVKWIHGYPSAINVLAEYVLSNGIELPLEFVTTGAENLLEFQKSTIKRAFGCMPYEHYGMAEAVANISEDKNYKMHIDEDFAAVELLPLNSDTNEIVGTNLSNYAMPLLRYRTGDTCKVDDNRNILSIDGRLEDYVVLPNGSKVGRLDHVFKDLVHIREAQIIQKSPCEIIVKIVKNSGYDKMDEDTLFNELRTRLLGVNCSVVYVSSLPRTKTGKLRFVVSEIDK